MKFLPILTFLLICISCNGKQKEKNDDQVLKKPVFEMVTVPNILTEPQDRANYAIEHFWDKFNFSDTTYIHFPEVTEQAFSNYLYIMANADSGISGEAIGKMLKKAEVEKKVYTYFTDLYEKYLYDPNAPTRNEELYIYVLKAMLQSSVLDDVEKIRPAHLLEIAMKNRLNEPATDFEFTLANNTTNNLYNVKSDYLILYFYNPDCENCREITKEMAESELLNKLIKANKLKILSIYPDEDQEQWKNHIPEMQTTWINGYDRDVKLKNEEIYDLKAIPCLYLLDKNKTVLLKDAPIEQIQAYLYNNTSI